MATKARIKTPAQRPAPQTEDECAADIRQLGDLHRERARTVTQMDDEIAAITARYQPVLMQLDTTISDVQKGVQTYCEAHRHRITFEGKTKTANFVTGSVQWRQRPPSVSVRGIDTVIDALRSAGLTQLLRTKDEINKDAILAEPGLVKDIAGIKVVTGIEDFVVVPFEANTGVAA